ncbi:MAG TPA: SpoIIE family protein phosphatase [Terriglobales bacterium]
MSAGKSVGLQTRPPHRFILQLILTFAAYLLAGEIGLAVPFTSANVSPLWPPAGLALAAILIYGKRVWPAVALGAFAVNYFSGLPYLAALGIAAGNTLGALCGASFLIRLPRFQTALTRLRDVLALSVLGALCGSAASATVGILVLHLAGRHAWSGFESGWLMWWFGDAIGILVVTPLVLTLPSLMLIRGKRRLIELCCLLFGAVGSLLVIFDPRLGFMRPDVFAFGVFPFVLWGAIRFQSGGAAIVSFLVSAIAVWGTAHGFGPFVQGDAFHNATLLQAFLAVTTVSGITLAAVIAERAELERMQSATEAVDQSEKKYRGIVETANEGIWKLDAKFATSFVNPRMAALLGYTVEEMQGRPVFDFLYESDFERKRCDLLRRSKGVSEELQTRYRKKDGSALWARVATAPMFNQKGIYEGALAMVSDITLQKRTETEASCSREQISLLSQAVEQTADGVVITDCQGIIEYVNPAFEKTTGYSRAEAVGNTPRLLNSGIHAKGFYNSLWDRILEGEPFRGTLVNRKKSGELYWTEQTITPIKDSTGKTGHFVSVHKDITEFRKLTEQELQLGLAREVQQRFYANAAINVAGFDIATAACPAAQTGGDYVDLFSMPDGRICIGIGDVSGHGVGAALVMALTRAYIRSFAQVEKDLATILKRVNLMLLADLCNDRYVTLLLVCLDSAAQTLTYASAGHVPGVLLGNSGKVDHILESSGPPLGMFDDSRYVDASVQLGPQTLLVLLTDGAAETTASLDGPEFGTDGVLAYVHAHRHNRARELADGICDAARIFRGEYPQQDDVTGVVVKVA